MSNPLFDALLARHLNSDATFLKLPGGGCWSYRQTLDLSARYAHALAQLGAKPGDRVALQVEKSPQALVVYLACIRAGFVLLPLNTAYTPAELDYFVSDAKPAVILCDPAHRVDVQKIADRHGASVSTLDADGAGDLANLAKTQPATFETVARGGGDLAAILYTSGTTGRSKGAMLSGDNLLSNAVALTDAWQFNANDTLLHVLPIFHTHGLFVAVNITLIAGGAMIFLPRFDLNPVLRALPDATAMMGVPTYYTRLLGDARFTRDICANMRLFVSGSAPLSGDTHREFEQRTGHKILERYGMTETSMNTSNPYAGDRRPGAVGPALNGVEVIATAPETGAQVAPGQIGILEVRGPNVFLGYWKMPDKTAAELRENGFFITGDMGIIGDDGYVQIVGRAKDLIISGGLNVYPKEVETAIDGLDGVLESAVIGLPHPDLGEAVVAVVVLQTGASVTPQWITDTLRKELAAFKLPKKVVFVDELVRNTMGKVQKNILRDTTPGF